MRKSRKFIMQEELKQKYSDDIRQLTPVKNLSSNSQNCLIQQSEIIMIPAGNRLFEQHEVCDDVFYLLSGEVDLYFENTLIRTLTAGSDSSGTALNQIVTLSAIAKSRVVLFVVKRSLIDTLMILDETIGKTGDSGQYDWMEQFLSSVLLNQIPAVNRIKVFDRLDNMIVKRGDQVITQNMAGNYFYIIHEGRAIVSRQNYETGESITLAEIDIGDCFGEEALISDQKRNVSVTMQTPGSLMRLSRKDYDQLIQQPSLDAIDFARALSMISQGAQWIDVRSCDEFIQNRLRESHNIPLTELRQEIEHLPKENPYIVYCDTGARSSVAANLLSEHGFDVSYLKGGLREYSGEIIMSESWLDGLSDFLRYKEQVTEQLPDLQRDLAIENNSMGEQILEIDRRIRNLKDMFSTENILAQQWLEDQQHDQPEQDLGVLVEARKKIEHIENTPPATHHEKQSDSNDSELGILRKQLETAQSHLQEERSRVAAKQDTSEHQELTLRRVSDELETIKNRLKEQETFELRRRESFEQQLAMERKKVREQLARFSLGLERQQSRSMEIEKIRQIAALETRQVIKKFKDAHEQYRLRQQQTIQTVRKQLQQQAAHVIEKARKAQAEKKQAMDALRAVQKQLNELRKQRSLYKNDNPDSSEVPLLVDVESIGDEIDRAKEKFYEADSALTQAKTETRKNQEMLKQVNEDENSVRHELIDWFTSNDQFNLDRDDLTDEQKASLERVRKIAHEALEEAFNGNLPRSGPDDQFFKNYK